MTGVKGAGGPVPKRSDQRRGRNELAKKPTKGEGARRVPIPRADKDWHAVAKRWYNALGRSGQREFYEPSDWAAAWVLAESISRELQPQPMQIGRGEDAHFEMVSLPPKAASVAAWLKGMTSLMATEGDRRRAALELERPGAAKEDEGDVSWLDDARRRLRESG